ncbi:hypothetical protein C1646_672148 [Rhizophagus diaphanus]|nr:hypothetical protein C1646_672148 [Rhizophagus diaphanus] [Rhizophagus sp. MUCL 43196]
MTEEITENKDSHNLEIKTNEYEHDGLTVLCGPVLCGPVQNRSLGLDHGLVGPDRTVNIPNDGDEKEVREKKFVLLSMKEEWNKAEKNLARRTNLMITHLSIAIIIIVVGVCLFLLAKYNTNNKILKITLPSFNRFQWSSGTHKVLYGEVQFKFISFPILILFIPLAIYYRLLNRTYLEDHEIYFGKYNTENDDVTFFGTEVDAKLVLNLVLKLLNYDKTDEEIKDLIKDLPNTNTRTCFCNNKNIKNDDYLTKNKMNDKENIKISAILAGELIKKLETKKKSSNGQNGEKSGGALIEDWKQMKKVVMKMVKILKYRNETLMKAYLMALKSKDPNNEYVKDYKKHHTQNDDEIIKLAMKIIKKKTYRKYLRNDMKYFNFKDIYRYTISDDFQYLNWEDFKNRFYKFLLINDKIILKLEPIELTEKHKYEIKRLLSGLDSGDDGKESKESAELKV